MGSVTAVKRLFTSSSGLLMRSNICVTRVSAISLSFSSSPSVDTLPRLSRVLVPVHKLLPQQSAIKPSREPWHPPSCPRRSNLLCRLLAVRTAPVLLPWLGVAGKKCRVRSTCSRYIHTILDSSFFFLSYFGASTHETHVGLNPQNHSRAVQHQGQRLWRLHDWVVLHIL